MTGWNFYDYLVSFVIFLIIKKQITWRSTLRRWMKHPPPPWGGLCVVYVDKWKGERGIARPAEPVGSTACVKKVLYADEWNTLPLRGEGYL